MWPFKRKETDLIVKVTLGELIDLKTRAAMVDKCIALRDKEIAFFKDRGDRYSALRDHFQAHLMEVLKLALSEKTTEAQFAAYQKAVKEVVSGFQK